MPTTGYHRYQGTVGGRPLTIGPNQYDSTQTVCAGVYYYGAAQLDLLNAARFAGGLHGA
ncbi:hypothetical protein GCM10023172_34500 [Hymenobacter ginsengisoli]|uniref:Uncharacterized protein n=1 Tax=Hymenobacter ginsengisoli TaxID=1051626 RepID=A0ABP8QMM8_9BACT|nr:MULTISPECIES: hypothetical protein [unclassified Hymenobacter]MBO2033031.1 hypothetical protein [Hymenobacter sp. BT559]